MVPRRLPAPRIRLICFPYAGGSAAIFRTWTQALPADAELWALQLPGRTSRLREPALTSVDAILDAIAAPLAEARSVPYVLFGHSMGAKLVYALARRLAADSHPPRHVIVSGARPPHLPPDRAPIHHLGDAEFLQQVKSYGGMPTEVLASQELLELILPALRADFAASDSWTCPADAHYTLPLTAIGGTTDPHVPVADLTRWTHLAPAAAIHTVHGGHFFLHDLPSMQPFLNAVLTQWRP
jgi:surfactin synthase thioesterase subunit